MLLCKWSGSTLPLIRLSYIKCFFILELHAFLFFLHKEPKTGHVVKVLCQQTSYQEFTVSIKMLKPIDFTAFLKKC